jgi:hypothetical protein
MLDLPVLKSTLEVLWHLEHLAASGDENMSRDVLELQPELELDVELDLLDELDGVIESSLVTWSRFCCGTGRGLIGDAWAASDCILMRSEDAMFVARCCCCGGVGRYESSECDGSQSGCWLGGLGV